MYVRKRKGSLSDVGKSSSIETLSEKIRDVVKISFFCNHPTNSIENRKKNLFFDFPYFFSVTFSISCSV